MIDKFKNKKVLIAIPSYSGSFPSLMVESLLQLKKPIQCGFSVIDRQRIDKCRNFFVKQALDGGFDYLFMVDDDNPIPPETLEKLLEGDKDIITVPILSRNPIEGGEYPMCAFYREDRKIKKKTIPYYIPIKKFKEGGYLHKIDAAGTGCILIKRKVLEKISKEYEYPFEFGDITVEGQRRTMSEDAEFSERAVKCGFEIWLDESIVPVHIGRSMLIKYNKEKI